MTVATGRLRALAPVLALLMLGCSPRFEWRELQSADGFTALMPGRPQMLTRDLEVAGEKVAMTMWSTGIGPTMFAVGTARLPAAAIADEAARTATIGHFRDALVRNIGASEGVRAPVAPRLAVGEARKLLAAEAVEAVGPTNPDGRKSRLAARFFIVDDRFFQVVALGAEGEIPPEALDTFFTSFRLAP